MFDNINNDVFKGLKNEVFNTIYILNDYMKYKPNKFNINPFYDLITKEQIISRESIETIKPYTNINYLLPELSLKKEYGELFVALFYNKFYINKNDKLH
jgi:hypothetical protein